MSDEPRTPCRTPAADGATRIPTWKFDLIRRTILTVIDAQGGAVFFKELSMLVGARLSEEERARLGSLGWHVTTVKLEMEVAGDIRRADGKGPQKLSRA